VSGRYVAIGSSMAAGPGIKPRVPGSPMGAGRSTLNYPHVVAQRLGYDLVDVTYSGATTANVLTDPQRGVPPQVDALDGSEQLVTVTIGGNDAGYVPLLFAAGLPRFTRSVPLLGPVLRDQLDAAARDRSLALVPQSLRAIGREVRRRAPQARVLFVDYLTLLPAKGTPAPPLSDVDADVGRRIAEGLARATADGAAETGCDVVRSSEASREHHPWSDEPWTTRFGLPWPGRPAPLHPNAAGMRAVADLVVATLN